MHKIMSARMWIRDTANTQITDWVTSHCVQDGCESINTELELYSKQQKFRAEISADFTQVVHVRAMIIGLTSDSIMTAARSS